MFVVTPTKILDSIIKVYEEKMGKINILIIVLRAILLGTLTVLASVSAAGSKSNSDKA